MKQNKFKSGLLDRYLERLFAQIPYFYRIAVISPFERHTVMTHNHFLMCHNKASGNVKASTAILSAHNICRNSGLQNLTHAEFDNYLLRVWN